MQQQNWAVDLLINIKHLVVLMVADGPNLTSLTHLYKVLDVPTKVGGTLLACRSNFGQMPFMPPVMIYGYQLNIEPRFAGLVTLSTEPWLMVADSNCIFA